MTPFEQAIARQRAYYELSQIFLYGITSERVAFLENVLSAELFAKLTDNFEAHAAEHYQIFGLNVFPYATIFLHDDMLLGTEFSSQVEQFYREVGFVDYKVDMPDHIGNTFGLLSFLSGAEADALEDKITQEFHRMQNLQRRFLEEHLLRWLPALNKAIQSQRSKLYAHLSELVLNLVINHYQKLVKNSLPSVIKFQLPEPPQILEHEKTGIKQISEYLLVPAYTGLYISRDTIRQLGNQHHIPHGFGKRHQILTNLFRTAAEYELLNDLIDSLCMICNDWQLYYQELEIYSELMPFTQIWIQRLQQTASLLDTITTAIQTPNLVKHNETDKSVGIRND